MDRNYFCFYDEHPVFKLEDGSYFKVLPEQPIKVERYLDNYVFLIDHIGSEINCSLGYFRESISEREEAEMWRMVADYHRMRLAEYLRKEVKESSERLSKIQELRKEIQKRDEAITGLKKALSF